MGPAALRFFHSLARKNLTKNQGSGIITIPNRMTSESEASAMIQTIVDSGLPLEKFDQFIRSEDDILKYLNIIKNANKQRVIPADSLEGRGITEALFGKRGEVVDFPQKRSFKQEVDDMIKDGTITKGPRGMKKSKKVQDREMFQDANKRLKTDVNKIIADIKAMDPMDSMKEANSVIGRKGAYKNLTPEESKKILKDTEDHIFERDIPEEDFAGGGRAGFKGGGLTESDYLKVKDMLNHYFDYRKSGGTLSKTKFANAFFRENNADGGVAGLLGERPGYQSGLSVLGLTPEHNEVVADMQRNPEKYGIQNQFDYAAASAKDMVNKASNPLTSVVSAIGNVAGRPVYDAIDAAKEYSKKGYQGEFSLSPQGAIDFGKNMLSLGGEFLNQKPVTMMGGALKGGIQSLGTQLGESIYDKVNPEEDDEYDFSDIEGQTAFVGLPEIFALGKSIIGPAIGLSKSGLSKKAIAEALIKDRLRKEAGKKFKKIITPPKYPQGGTIKTKGPTTTTRPGGDRGRNIVSGRSGDRDFSVKGPDTSANPTGKSNRASQARGYALHGADGGLANFADGGPARQNFKMGKRAFLKAMLGTGAGIAGLKSGLFATGGKEVTKKAVTETVKSAGNYPPPYFFKLVEKIKFMGDDVTQKAATQDRQVVKRYKDYEMSEDLGTGEIVIKKRNEGSFYDQDGIISDEYIVYKPGQADELTKGKKPPPEYDEYTVRPDADGKLRDSEDGLDSIDEILEEVGDPDSMTLKKASGGIARMLGE